MRDRKEYKGTKYDHLVGTCCECGAPVMFSDCEKEVIVNWDEKRALVYWHRKCHKKLMPAEIETRM